MKKSYRLPKILLWCAAFALVGVAPSFAMSGAKPQVQLAGFKGFYQETNLWCWAAVTQMAYVQLKHPSAPPAQCKIVSNVLGKDCCTNEFAPGCVQTHDVEDAARKTNLSFRWANPMMNEITEALDAQRVPVMLLYNEKSHDEHVVIAYGYSRAQDGSYTAFLYDPSTNTPHELEVGQSDLTSRRFYNEWIWAGSAVVSK